MTTKILALTNALDNLVKFVLMLGQRHDTKGVKVNRPSFCGGRLV